MDLEELKKEIIKFRDDRDWKKYHNAKDLAISLNLEASEVLELFQWKGNEEVNKEKLADELADVFNYLILLANEIDVDLVEITSEKLKKNCSKYPVDKIKGNYKKYTEL